MRTGRARPPALEDPAGGGVRGAADRPADRPPATRVAFRHALLRDAVYEEIAEPRRRGLHHELGASVAGLRAAGRDPAGRPRSRAICRLAGADAEAVPQLAAGGCRRARRRARSRKRLAYLEEALAIAPGPR